MSQLQLIWELENHNNILDDYKKEYDFIKNHNEIKTLQKQIIDMKSRISSLEEELEIYTIEIRKKENILKDDNFNLKLIIKDLYDGNIDDLKQLELLNEEKDSLSGTINDKETEILLLMEEAETLENKLNKIEKELKEIEEKESKVFKGNLEQKHRLEESIISREKMINEISNRIEVKVLKRYNALRKNRGSGIVKVSEYICQGCNMRIPTYLGEPLKKKAEIIYCESCGRILYFSS